LVVLFMLMILFLLVVIIWPLPLIRVFFINNLLLKILEFLNIFLA
jgi:hypothetical protein